MLGIPLRVTDVSLFDQHWRQTRFPTWLDAKSSYLSKNHSFNQRKINYFLFPIYSFSNLNSRYIGFTRFLLIIYKSWKQYMFVSIIILISFRRSNYGLFHSILYMYYFNLFNPSGALYILSLLNYTYFYTCLLFTLNSSLCVGLHVSRRHQ